MSPDASLPNLIALTSVLSAGLLGYLGYIRSKKADATTAKGNAVEQVLAGLNALVDNLQDDNKVLRESVREIRDALQKTTDERDKIKKELQAIRRKYGQTHK